MLRDSETPTSGMRTAVWTLSNLCRGKAPRPRFRAIEGCLPMLATLLHNPDPEVVQDACWALTYLRCTFGVDV